MQGWKRISAVGLLAVALAACSSIQAGRDFDLGAFAGRVERGVTTREQVRVWLGEPTSIGVSVGSDGERLDEWAYFHAESRLSGSGDASVKLLQVKFDRDGHVRSYNWSASK